MKICSAPWLNLTIHHSGKVVPCCPDMKLEYVLGDVRKQTLTEIYESPRLERLKIAHLRGELDFAPCKGCLNRDAYERDIEEILVFLSKNNKERDIKLIFKHLKGSISQSKLKQEFLNSGAPADYLIFTKKFQKNLFQEHIKALKNQFHLSLTIETTNACSMNCIMCKVHEYDNLPPTFLSLEDFKKHMGSLIKSNIDLSDFRLFWLGEPSLHPQFIKILRYCCSKRFSNLIPYVAFDTTLTHFNVRDLKAITRIAGFKPIRILVSLDSVNKATYDTIRRGGNFNRAINNIKALFHLRLAAKQEYPKIMIQFIVMKENVKEIQQFKQYWEIFFKQNGIKMNYFLNASLAEDDGINFRALIEEEDSNGSLQRKAYSLFTQAIKKVGLNG